jgi:hypothetical protein
METKRFLHENRRKWSVTIDLPNAITYRFIRFVIYTDFDRVEFATAKRHVVTVLIGVSHDLAESFDDVADE